MKAGKVFLKICLAVLMVFIASDDIMAQESKLFDSSFARYEMVEETGPIVGMKAGLVMSNFSGSDAQGLGSGFTPAVAGFIRIGSDKIALQPEVWYIQKGARIPMGGPTYILKFSYLDIPILFKFPDPFSRRGVRNVNMMYFGPVVGIKMSSSLQAKAGGVGVSVDLNNTKSVDFGLAIGGDSYWRVGRTVKIFVDGRFAFSLNKSFQDAPYGAGNFVDESGKAPRLNHIVFSFMFGVGF